MMLGYNLDGKVIFENFYILVGTNGVHQSALNLRTCIIGMMKNTKFRMSSLAMQIELSVFFLVEMYSPLNQLSNLRRCILHYLLDGSPVANVIASHHCVFNMLFKIIYQKICYRSNASLRLGGVCLLKGSLTYDGYFSFIRTCYF